MSDYLEEELNKVLGKAICFASFAHYEQQDKIGKPYILHPIAVMMSVESTEAKIVAILHDTMEDCGISENELRQKHIPQHLIEAVVAISKITYPSGRGELTELYLDRVKANPLALEVKLADIAHNTSYERMVQLKKKTRIRLTKKYAEALEYLKN